MYKNNNTEIHYTKEWIHIYYHIGYNSIQCDQKDMDRILNFTKKFLSLPNDIYHDDKMSFNNGSELFIELNDEQYTLYFSNGGIVIILHFNFNEINDLIKYLEESAK